MCVCERQTDRQTDRQTGRQTRQTDRENVYACLNFVSLPLCTCTEYNFQTNRLLFPEESYHLFKVTRPAASTLQDDSPHQFHVGLALQQAELSLLHHRHAPRLDLLRHARLGLRPRPRQQECPGLRAVESVR